MYEKVCEDAACGKSYRTKWAKQRHCSHACANRHRPRPTGLYILREFVCKAPGCANAFTSRNPTARYCSRRCQTQGGAWSYQATAPLSRRATM